MQSPTQPPKMISSSESNEDKDELIRVEILMPRSLVEKIDRFREEWGIKSRGAIAERLLQELLEDGPLGEDIFSQVE